MVGFGANTERADPFDFVFDEGVIRTYDLTVADDDWTWLNEHPLDEEYVPGRLTFEGREYDDVGVRYKGFYGQLRFCFDAAGNQTCDKIALKLKFSEYDRRGRFYGLKRLNFHSMHEDDSQLREALAYRLYREAGVAAPRTAFAWVTVNGEPHGLFLVVENIDDRFVATHFRDGGNGKLYKEVWPEHETAAAVSGGVGSGVPGLGHARREPLPDVRERDDRGAHR